MSAHDSSGVVVLGPGAPTHDWARLGYGTLLDWPSSPALSDVRRDLTASRCLLVAGPVSTLHAVVAGLHRLRRLDEAVLAYVPGVAGPDRAFAERLGLPKAPATLGHGIVRRIRLARDDLGGVLLDTAIFSLAAKRDRSFGAQAYHDDTLIADGPTVWIDVTTDLADDSPGLVARVKRTGIRRSTTSRGRAVQIACDTVQLRTDGLLTDTHKRAFYVDDRAYWNIQTT